MSRGQSSTAVHATVDLIVSRAMLEGKTGTTDLKLPLLDLIDEYEGVRFQPEAAGLVLKIKIITSWEEGDEADMLSDVLQDTEDPEDDDGEGNNYV